jgi:2'-5' RNA ligase
LYEGETHLFKELLSIAIIVLIGFVARKRGVLGKREANLLNAVVMKFSLAEAVRKEFPPEKQPFRPHLTIGRVKDARAIPVLKEAADLKLGRFTVERVSLIQSALTRSGPIYTRLHEFPLAGEVEGWEEKGLD